jgi:hypothetical protein
VTNHADLCRLAAAMLRSLEWQPNWHFDDSCVRCGHTSHTPTCDLWSMIRELEAVEGTAARVLREEQEAQHAAGTCPRCGYWNHPEATAYDRADLVYCNACGETWTPKETHGPEAPQ